MKNPNSKADLIAIIDRLFEEIDDFHNAEGIYLVETTDEAETILRDQISSLALFWARMSKDIIYKKQSTQEGRYDTVENI